MHTLSCLQELPNVYLCLEEYLEADEEAAVLKLVNDAANPPKGKSPKVCEFT
jgi:hypothetical protein